MVGLSSSSQQTRQTAKHKIKVWKKPSRNTQWGESRFKNANQGDGSCGEPQKHQVCAWYLSVCVCAVAESFSLRNAWRKRLARTPQEVASKRIENLECDREILLNDTSMQTLQICHRRAAAVQRQPVGRGGGVGWGE